VRVTRLGPAGRALPYLLAFGVALVAILALVPRPQPDAVRVPVSHVVLAGAPGLRWDDVSPFETPNLWALAREGSVGALTVRSARTPTCPVDGWLTLGAGNYTRGPDEPVDGACPLEYPRIEPAGDGALLPPAERAALSAENDEIDNDTELGALSESARCTAAVGPGAALAAARPFGRIDRYQPSVDEGISDLLAGCALSFVDLGIVDGTGTARVVAARRADAALAAVLGARPARSLVVVAGLSDTDEVARLHVAVAHGPGFGPGWLTSPSTGRDGYLRLIDLAPTVLAALDRPAPVNLFAGAAATREPGRPASLTAAVDRLADADRLAGAQRRVSTTFFLVLTLAQLALFVAVIPLLRRRPGAPGARVRLDLWRRGRAVPAHTPSGSRPAAGAEPPRVRRRLLPGRLADWLYPRLPSRLGERVEWALLAAALAVPAAMATDVVPWWRAGRPGLTFSAIFAVVLIAATAVAGLATARHRALWPLGGVAGAVAVAIALDVLTGARLQLDGITGYSALAGARYAGIGTVGFGMFTGCVLLVAAALAQRAARPWRPVVVTAVGGLGAVIVGSPYFGADAAGAVGLTAGVCTAAAMSVGGWLSYRRLTWAVLAGFGLTTLFALLDLRRPAEQRSSVGRFWAHVDDGTAELVVRRGGESSIVTVADSPLTLLVLGVALYTGLVLLRDWGGLRRVYGLFPAVRGALAGTIVATLLVGVVEGVGLNVTGAALAVALPLVVLAVLRVRHQAADRTIPVVIDPPLPDKAEATT
jgi:hypothetical protein